MENNFNAAGVKGYGAARAFERVVAEWAEQAFDTPCVAVATTSIKMRDSGGAADAIVPQPHVHVDYATLRGGDAAAAQPARVARQPRAPRVAAGHALARSDQLVAAVHRRARARLGLWVCDRWQPEARARQAEWGGVVA